MSRHGSGDSPGEKPVLVGIINAFFLALWCIVDHTLFLDCEHGGLSEFCLLPRSFHSWLWLLVPILFVSHSDVTHRSFLPQTCTLSVGRCSVTWKWASITFPSWVLKKSFNSQGSYTASVPLLCPYSSVAQTICNNPLAAKGYQKRQFSEKNRQKTRKTTEKGQREFFLYPSLLLFHIYSYHFLCSSLSNSLIRSICWLSEDSSFLHWLKGKNFMHTLKV